MNNPTMDAQVNNGVFIIVVFVDFRGQSNSQSVAREAWWLLIVPIPSIGNITIKGKNAYICGYEIQGEIIEY